MRFELTPELEIFRDTTRKFLDAACSAEQVRSWYESGAALDPDYWAQGAALGWTSLTAGEQFGGGSVSGDVFSDLSTIAFELGFRAAPGALLGSNLMIVALTRCSNQALAEEWVPPLMRGQAVAAWAFDEPPPNDRLGEVAVTVTRVGKDFRLDGVKGPVEVAPDADVLLVTGRTPDGLRQFVVPSGTPGVRVQSLRSLDMTRRAGRVEFDGVLVPSSAAVGGAGELSDEIEFQLSLALILQQAESVGAMQRAFDMTVAWLFDRHSFGRPLASYQELKHRVADMKTWLEAGYAITAAAASAATSDPVKAAELACAAKAYVGTYGVEMLQDCVQMHGGIGVTFDHDLHFFLRRIVVNAALYGAPREHRRKLGVLVVPSVVAA